MDGQLNDLVGEWFDIEHRDRICVSSLAPEKTAYYRAGEPSNDYPVIKVGGTNGKGSTTRFIAWSLINSGHDVGVMSNPSATTDPTAVIQINRESIPRDTLKSYCEEVFNIAPDNIEPYGIRTIAAMQWFADNDVDAAVFEAGVGGKTDATNLATGIATAITTVGEDHMESLGGSPVTVQSHIAGLADTETPVIVNAARDNNELYTYLRHKSSSVVRANPHCDFFHNDNALTYRASVNYDDKITEVETPFIAPYQQHNIDTALTTLSEIRLSVTPDAVFDTITNFEFAARSELIEYNNTRVLLDGAHNTPGIESLVAGLREIPHDVTFVFSALSDKDWQTMVETLDGVGDVIMTKPQGSSRTGHDDELKHSSYTYVESPLEAVETAVSATADSQSVVCVTGSLYLMRKIRPELLPE